MAGKNLTVGEKIAKEERDQAGTAWAQPTLSALEQVAVASGEGQESPSRSRGTNPGQDEGGCLLTPFQPAGYRVHPTRYCWGNLSRDYPTVDDRTKVVGEVHPVGVPRRDRNVLRLGAEDRNDLPSSLIPYHGR